MANEALTEDLVAQHAAMLGAEPINAIPYELNENGDLITRRVFGGFTKRELFAAMALQGALGGTPGSHLTFENLARDSVAHADALLKELVK